MPNADFRHPQDIEMGPDGALYVLEWGRDFNYAGSGINPDSGLYRIDYAKGTRTPVAEATRRQGLRPGAADRRSSRATGSEDPDGDALTYAWDFGDGTATSTEANPTHTFTTAGTYTVRLTVDRLDRQVRHVDGRRHRRQHAADGRARRPPQGGVYDWGDEIAYKVDRHRPRGRDDRLLEGRRHRRASSTTRAATPTCTRASNKTGCEGTIEVEQESGHEKSANIALVLTATYTDNGARRARSRSTGADDPAPDPEADPGRALHRPDRHPASTTRAGAEGGRRVGCTDAGRLRSTSSRCR